MANVTLKIDDEILEKARQLAQRRNTSVNAIVRQTLEDFVSSDRSRESAIVGLEAFWLRTNAKVGRRAWTRDELHER